jgi:signal transduction histidine kinase
MSVFLGVKENILPISSETALADVLVYFKNHPETTIIPIVTANSLPLGILKEKDFKYYVYSPLGKEVLLNKSLNKSINDFLIHCSIVDINSDPDELLALFTREENQDGIILTKDSKYFGFLSSYGLLRVLNLRQAEEKRIIEEKNSLLIRTQKQLVQAEKMASLGGLVAGVAHEINTPVGMALTGVTHIDQVTKKVRDKYMGDEMTEEDFTSFLDDCDEINRSVIINLNKAADLIRSFKQVAVDQSSEEARSFNLKEYIEEVLISLHNRIKKTKIEVELNIDNNIVIISIPGVFSQILTNFVMNSIVHGFEPDELGLIGIEAQKYDSKLHLIYKDNGKGMDEKTREKVFEPFFTTKRNAGGSGLGMNIVFNLATQTLGGTIECESSVGKGVIFKLIIPV